jgi:ABC-type Zn uptake system ZnuABC Zn-binding protein ZnuA
MRFPRRFLLALFAVLSLIAAACGSDDAVTAGDAPADAPTVAVTTNILGDVVTNIVGDQLNVVTIMPVGADPHDFQASAQQVAQIGEAQALIVNGAAFEEGLLDVIETAEADGIAVHEAISGVSTIEFGEGGHDDHGHDDEHGDEDHDDEHGDEDHDDEHGDEDHEDEGHEDEEHSDEDHDDEDHDEHGDEDHDDEHGDEEHSDEDHDDHEDEEHSDEDHDEHGDEDHDEHEGHDHSGDDPHFFTDPARMAVAADGIADFLIANVDGVDADALRASADAYIAELNELDAEVSEILSSLTDEQRVLVTNHEVFGYFADNYGFEVVGSVIPSGTTADGANAQALAELAEVISAEGVPAIFADTSSSDELVQTLADEVGDIEVVELFSESLGDADSDGGTYIDMVRANANRIAGALGA